MTCGAEKNFTCYKRGTTSGLTKVLCQEALPGASTSTCPGWGIIAPGSMALPIDLCIMGGPAFMPMGTTLLATGKAGEGFVSIVGPACGACTSCDSSVSQAYYDSSVSQAYLLA